jgi:predicted nuclease of restriction endonuclease-like RecB superfamily
MTTEQFQEKQSQMSNEELISLAKEEIRKFLFKMCDLLEVDERKEVYELQVSLFPLSNRNSDP